MALKARLGVFERTINERTIHDVNAQEIDSFLRALPGGPVNRNNYRRVLGILYSFAVKQRYTLKNPVREVAIANVEVTKPGILTIAEARAMLEAATPDFLPVIALGLFAGLRPESEIWRLAWSNIDFEDRVIDVQKSKNVASHRFVRIPDNLLAWLKPYANKKGQVSIRNDAFFRRMRATRAGAVTALEGRAIAADNLRDWPSDCLRR
jgi:integrase